MPAGGKVLLNLLALTYIQEIKHCILAGDRYPTISGSSQH